MQNIKLHEATKQFKISNKLAMFFLEKKNVPVKSHSSVISMEQLELLREFSQNQDKYQKLINEFNQPPKAASKKAKASPIPKKETEPEVKPEVSKKKKPEKKQEETQVKQPIVSPPEKTQKKEEKKFQRPPVPPSQPKIKSDISPKKIPKIERPTHPRIEIKKVQEKIIKPEPRKETVKTVIPKKKTETVILPELIQISDFISFKELCEKLNLKMKDVEEKLKHLKQEYQTNQLLSAEDVKSICAEFKVEFDVLSYEDYVFYEYIGKHNIKMIPRAPVVTVMGHVDHGKTTLLDNLRKTHVAENEAGGITQKIGATILKVNKNNIVFIDTPGHEAFTNLRARGAKVTDIIILVVAANDGVKPQTIEAINHARAAEVPIIVAINKIDLKGADPEKVKKELSQHNIIVEDWGGDVVSVEISAKTGDNIGNLLEMITLVAEMQELNAYQDIPARGTIIESRLDSKLGPLGTLLIQHGRLERGDYFICGNLLGKIKSIFNERGEPIDNAEVPMPVEIMGFDDVPNSGDKFQVIDDIEKARKIIEIRKFRDKETKKDEIVAEKKLSLQNLFKKIEESKTKTISTIIKTDNFGSGEVIEKFFQQRNSENLKIDIIHKGIGNITEGDVLLASAADAFIVGFNVKSPQKVLALAKRENVDIKLYNVIYHLIEDIDKAIKGEIKPEYMTSLIGKIEVLQKFKISKVGTIAGCIVKEGKVSNKSKLKVLRGNDLVFEGDIETLKRVKDEVSEVRAGTECGIRIKNFNSIEVGDIIEAYELTLKK